MGNERVYLGLGSNVGDRAAHLARMCVGIGCKIGSVVSQSSLYESEPWGFECSTSFFNQVVVVETELSPESILDAIAVIEQQLGRQRPQGVRYAARTADIDILLYGELVIHTPPRLVVPHPQIPYRRFVLAPLCEVAPEGFHPTLGRSWRELWAACPDTGWIKRL